MQKGQLLYLSRDQVMDVGVGMQEILDTLKTGFIEKGQGRVEMPPKPGIHPGGGGNFIHAMPASIPALEAAGIKWVSAYPGNPGRGIPTIHGLIILNDPHTGIILGVLDCGWITAMRTAAATVLSASFLARANSAVAGILGCGMQGRTHLEALQLQFPLTLVRAYDSDPQKARLFSDEMGARYNLEVVPVKTPREAVSGCDLIITAGAMSTPPHQTIKPGWMEAGSFASLVDFDSYWHPQAVQQADRFCTDDLEQMAYYRKQGYFKDYPVVSADLGELVCGQKPGRQSETERTITANLGMGMEDVVTAALVFSRAVERGLGTWLPV
jgi:ornithine cyclodeaminase/alanine dehydrogenase-like protein (mu-crystallin family)